MLTENYAHIAPGLIRVEDARQRSEIDLDSDGLRASVSARGIMVPLLVTSDTLTLVAGQRRLTCALALGLADVPVRYVREGLTPHELRLIELEENIRRSALPWRDEVRAVAELHAIWMKERPQWTQEKSASELGHDMRKFLRVARELANPRLESAIGVQSAWNICQRIDQRAADSALEEISESMEDFAQRLDGEAREFAEANGMQAAGGDASASTEAPTLPARAAAPATRSAQPPPPPPEPVLCADFIEWAKTYSGPRFNFIHCDFPYGVRVSGGQWGGKHAEEEFKYDDSPDVYWQLIEALCAARARLFAGTAHLMFWLSSDIRTQAATIERFRALAPELIFQPRALTWHKSDNTGIVPDPKRGPRWICETALMASLGDRILVRPLASSYSAPTARALHPSAKPEPVLRHFFGMFVDDTTRMLDPTCGAGSALRAAESLNAQSVLGIEREEAFASSARKALRDFRNLRELTR